MNVPSLYDNTVYSTIFYRRLDLLPAFIVFTTQPCAIATPGSRLNQHQGHNEHYDDLCASRGGGTRPGGCVGRGPAFMGGIDRVTAPSTGKVISLP